jgi:hypothetical protein
MEFPRIRWIVQSCRNIVAKYIKFKEAVIRLCREGKISSIEINLLDSVESVSVRDPNCACIPADFLGYNASSVLY